MLRIVLRLLLCLTLVLNGAGYAVAATQMQIAHEAMARTAAAQPAEPCHQAADAGRAHMAPPTGPSSLQGHGTDCCQTSLCTCDCLQHATAAMALVAMPSAALPGRGLCSPRETRSPAPPFHTPLRPPIA